MKVRLAFAVAAHLEPDILIVDEVLAVGDAEFQKKAIGKMKDISGGDGRTVLFVSHNMTAVANLCKNVYVLNKGIIDFYGGVDESIEHYLKIPDKKRVVKNKILPEDDCFKLEHLTLLQNGTPKSEFYTNKKIEVQYTFIIKNEIVDLRIGFDLIDINNSVIFRTFHDDEKKGTIYKKGTYSLKAFIPENFLKTGNYSINIVIGIHNVRWISFRDIILPISLYNIKGINNQYADDRPGIIMPLIDWESKKII
jgi:lipopolysaccharide transport system ATP-binding protein